MKGVRIKSPYQDRPVRPDYRLTDKGRDHYRVVMAIVTWGDRHYAGPAGAPLLHRHKTCGCDFAPVMTCWECRAPVTAREVETRPGPGAGA